MSGYALCPLRVLFSPRQPSTPSALRKSPFLLVHRAPLVPCSFSPSAASLPLVFPTLAGGSLFSLLPALPCIALGAQVHVFAFNSDDAQDASAAPMLEEFITNIKAGQDANGTYVGDFHAIVAGGSAGVGNSKAIAQRGHDLGILQLHCNQLASPLECARAAQKRAGSCPAVHTRDLQSTVPVAIGAGLVPVSTGVRWERPSARTRPMLCNVRMWLFGVFGAFQETCLLVTGGGRPGLLAHPFPGGRTVLPVEGCGAVPEGG